MDNNSVSISSTQYFCSKLLVLDCSCYFLADHLVGTSNVTIIRRKDCWIDLFQGDSLFTVLLPAWFCLQFTCLWFCRFLFSQEKLCLRCLTNLTLFACFPVSSLFRASPGVPRSRNAQIFDLSVSSQDEMWKEFASIEDLILLLPRYIFLCATVIIWTNIPFSQIQYRRALTFGDMTTIACPKMIICDSYLQDSGSTFILCKAFFPTQC